MSIKRPKPEDIVVELRRVEVLMGQGMARIDAIRQIGVSEQTCYRWKKNYGEMGAEHLGDLKRLRKENQRLRRAVSGLTLDEPILKEAAIGELRSTIVPGPMAENGLIPLAAVPASITFALGGSCRSAVCAASRVGIGPHNGDLTKGRADEERLGADMIEPTRQYGRYGCRRVAALLRDAGWQVNDKRVERRELGRHWSEDNARAAT